MQLPSDRDHSLALCTLITEFYYDYSSAYATLHLNSVHRFRNPLPPSMSTLRCV